MGKTKHLSRPKWEHKNQNVRDNFKSARSTTSSSPLSSYVRSMMLPLTSQLGAPVNTLQRSAFNCCYQLFKRCSSCMLLGLSATLIYTFTFSHDLVFQLRQTLLTLTLTLDIIPLLPLTQQKVRTRVTGWTTAYLVIHTLHSSSILTSYQMPWNGQHVEDWQYWKWPFPKRLPTGMVRHADTYWKGSSGVAEPSIHLSFYIVYIVWVVVVTGWVNNPKCLSLEPCLALLGRSCSVLKSNRISNLSRMFWVCTRVCTQLNIRETPP